MICCRKQGLAPASRETAHLFLGAGSPSQASNLKCQTVWRDRIRSLEDGGLCLTCWDLDVRLQRAISHRWMVRSVAFSPIQTSAEVPDLGHRWKDICLPYKTPGRLGLACSRENRKGEVCWQNYQRSRHLLSQSTAWLWATWAGCFFQEHRIHTCTALDRKS